MTAKKKEEDTCATKTATLDQLAKELPLFSVEDYVTSTKITPSGSLALDMAIGIGGYPSGCIIDTFGAESAGKSLLSIMAMAQIQKAGGVAVVWDVERSYSKNTTWLKVNGVDPSKLRFIKLRPEQGCEHGMDAVEKIASVGAADLIVVDSIPAMVPQACLEKSMTEQEVVSQRAKKLTNHLARLLGICDASKTSVMFINQVRANMGGGMYEAKEKETSIFALKHYASLRMAVTKLSGKDNIKLQDGVPIGHRVRVKLVKNKLAAPYRVAEFDLLYTHGVDQASEIADILIAADVANQAGAWVTFEKERFNGLTKFIEYIREPKNLERCRKQVEALNDKVNSFGTKPAPVAEDGSLNIEGEDA
jgi:recombination protein RecA